MFNLAKFSAHIAAGFVALVLLSSPASAEDDWVCGAWTKDPTGKCLEKRVCTRSKCKDVSDLTTCTKETRTECVKAEEPPKPPTRFNNVAPPVGGLPTTNDPGPGTPPGPANPNATTLDPHPERALTCLQSATRLKIRNLLGRWVPKGTTINWRLRNGSQGQMRLEYDLAPKLALTLLVPRMDWSPPNTPCQAWTTQGR
jgi:hypothetical protein